VVPACLITCSGNLFYISPHTAAKETLMDRIGSALWLCAEKRIRVRDAFMISAH
jgi:hypothetical protein